MDVYLYRLVPPRPDFPANITPQEGDAMQRHFGYWSDLMNQGTAVVFGPVADPAGSYGVAIVRLEPGADPQELGRNDPAISAGLGFRSEIHLMPQAVIKG